MDKSDDEERHVFCSHRELSGDFLTVKDSRAGTVLNHLGARDRVFGALRNVGSRVSRVKGRRINVRAEWRNSFRKKSGNAGNVLVSLLFERRANNALTVRLSTDFFVFLLKTHKKARNNK